MFTTTGRLFNIVCTLIYGLCGCVPSYERESVINTILLLYQCLDAIEVTMTIQSVLSSDNQSIFQNTISSEKSRLSLPQQLQEHIINGNVKGFKAALKILSPKK